MDVKPAEGKVVLRFVDDVDGDDEPAAGYAPMPSADYEGLLAIVIGVGAKVTGCKKGDTVVTSPWARDGLKLGDNTYVCDAWCIQATIK